MRRDDGCSLTVERRKQDFTVFGKDVDGIGVEYKRNRRGDERGKAKPRVVASAETGTNDERREAPEIRRGRRYDAIIMDPPSYGRGPSGEIWKLEDNLYPFVELVSKVLSDDPLFVIINSYTTGLAPSVLGYILDTLVSKKYGGKTRCDELGLPVTNTGLALPCGSTGRWTRD